MLKWPVRYKVKRYFPSPYRCKTCWRLGHTNTYCNSDPICKKCGEHQKTNNICVNQKCINCGQSDHEADSPDCPIYKEAKKVIRIAVHNNIDMREARLRYNNQHSKTSQRQNTSLTNSPLPQAIVPTFPFPPSSQEEEFQLLKTQMLTLQGEVKKINEKVIPNVTKNINLVKADLEEVKASCKDFNHCFDSLARNFAELKTILLAGRLPTTQAQPRPYAHRPTTWCKK